jgi:hypothetical protein
MIPKMSLFAYTTTGNLGDRGTAAAISWLGAGINILTAAAGAAGGIHQCRVISEADDPRTLADDGGGGDRRR